MLVVVVLCERTLHYWQWYWYLLLQQGHQSRRALSSRDCFSGAISIIVHLCSLESNTTKMDSVRNVLGKPPSFWYYTRKVLKLSKHEFVFVIDTWKIFSGTHQQKGIFFTMESGTLCQFSNQKEISENWLPMGNFHIWNSENLLAKNWNVSQRPLS
jgi:hypothetical protein